MEERRRAPRMKEENEVTITVVSGENNLPKEKTIDNYTKDVSVTGTKIKTNILLPIDSLIELEFTSKGVREQINALGKVKWVKVIIEDESYESGVEFCGTPSDAIKKLGDYISWKLKARARLIKKKLSPIDSIDINIEEAKKAPPMKNKQWIKIAIISLCTIILIVVLLKIFDYIPEFDSALFPDTNKEVTNNIAPDAVTTESANVPATPVAAPSPEVTSAPEVIPAPDVTPVPEATQKTKVIGNSDSKRYHLPGMKYYDSVKAYHRVEFDSEEDAIKAGYSKAPQ